MKKRMILVFMAGIFLLAGCGGSNSQSSSSKEEPAAKNNTVVIETSSVSASINIPEGWSFEICNDGKEADIYHLPQQDSYASSTPCLSVVLVGRSVAIGTAGEVTDLDSKVVDGFTLEGRSWKGWGMDAIEYIGNISDSYKVKIATYHGGIDMNDPEVNAIINSIKFTVK
jgi:hypothetical protein